MDKQGKKDADEQRRTCDASRTNNNPKEEDGEDTEKEVRPGCEGAVIAHGARSPRQRLGSGVVLRARSNLPVSAASNGSYVPVLTRLLSATILSGMTTIDRHRQEELLADLRRVAIERNALDLAEQSLALAARREGLSWRTIGAALNQTGEGVRLRHGKIES